MPGPAPMHASSAPSRTARAGARSAAPRIARSIIRMPAWFLAPSSPPAVRGAWAAPRRCCRPVRGGPTFVSRLARRCAPAGSLTCSSSAGPTMGRCVRKSRRWAPGVRYVENHHAEDGQISSIVAAANRDRPAGRAGLAGRAGRSAARAARHRCRPAGGFHAAAVRLSRGRPSRAARPPGHLRRGGFRRAARMRIAPCGARAVLRAHGGASSTSTWQTRACLIDVDDPDDYARVFGISALSQQIY